MVSKGFYSPRFDYNDFDDTEEEDQRIFWLNMAKFHRENRERKQKKFTDSELIDADC